MTPEADGDAGRDVAGQAAGCARQADRKIGSDLGDLAAVRRDLDQSPGAHFRHDQPAVAPARDALMPLWQTKLDVVAQ
ncbi:hypothetical protein ABIB87_008214 [Bradyrhizobium sp. JR18.2]